MINLLKNIKKYIYDYYDNKIASTIIGDVFYRFENLVSFSAVNQKFEEFSTDFLHESISFLIATKSQGLLLYENGEILRLFKEKGFYGITKFGEEFYVFYQTGLHGNIISFKLNNNKAIDVKIRIKGLSRGIHQIDFIDSDLYITNTYDNSILIYSSLHLQKNLHWKRYTDIIYPNGRLRNGRKSKNYNHFNSLFKYQENLFLIAHNETQKTSKKSELFNLSLRDFVVNYKEEIQGSNCHNIYIDGQDKIYCKSLEGVLCVNEEDTIKHENVFTRGLSVTDNHIILGGSDIQKNRNKRRKTNGYVYIYDTEFKLKQKLVIKKTQVQELKMVHNDKTFSNYSVT